MSADAGLALRSPVVEVWPQGGPSDHDGVTPDGRAGYLNEQVLWVRHSALEDSRCLLRVPEGVGWAGKTVSRRRRYRRTTITTRSGSGGRSRMAGLSTATSR